MHPDYIDEGRERRYFERASDVFGVTDADGVLRATSASGSAVTSRSSNASSDTPTR